MPATLVYISQYAALMSFPVGIRIYPKTHMAITLKPIKDPL